jgi:hypothetical protein
MIRKLSFTLTFILLGQLIFAQDKLPTIKATSTAVDIRDGESFKKAT